MMKSGILRKMKQDDRNLLLVIHHLIPKRLNYSMSSLDVWSIIVLVMVAPYTYNFVELRGLNASIRFHFVTLDEQYARRLKSIFPFLRHLSNHSVQLFKILRLMSSRSHSWREPNMR
jgi:hypothetical protein